jgi:outer membrane protein insertion porin family
MRTRILALLILVSGLGGLFAQTAEDWYQNKPIRTVTFEGLNHVSKTELDGIFAPYLGKNFNDELYWDILQKLYALEYFEQVSPLALPGDPEKSSVLLKFTVTEKPMIRAIKFSGNANVRAGDILEKINLKEGDIYNELKSRVDERSVRDLYLEKGFAAVKVSSSAQSNSDGSVTLTFAVEEGRQTVISGIEFEGNSVMASKTLKSILSLKEVKFLSAGLFKESMLEDDKATIRKYYLERGYIDATVENVVREVDTATSPEKNMLKLTFVIKEGAQYTYGGATISGNQVFKSEELLSKITLKEGDVMNMVKFEEGFQALADVYYENGYTSNYLNKQEKRDSDLKRVSFAINVAESPRSHIEHIIIKGNTKTKDHVIIREFQLEDGDIFSKSKLISSMRNLYNLRYFSTITPDFVQGSEQNLIDVVLNLEEQTTASVQFGFTYSGTTTTDSVPISIFTQWEESNFMGNGQTVSASLTASFQTQSLSLGFSENWFLGSPLTVAFNLKAAHETLYCYQDVQFPLFNDAFYDDNGILPDPYTSYDEYDDATSYDSSYKMQYQHWSFTLSSSTGYRWLPKFAIVTLRGGINFSVARNEYDATVYRPADADIRDLYGDWGWENSVWTRLSLDQRDVNYDPSRGWFLSEQLTYFGIVPMLDTEFYLRSETKAELYATLIDIPLSADWSFKLTAAFLNAFSFQVPVMGSDISDSNKLAIDGTFIGRGWTDLSDDSDTKGNVLLSHSLELRIPLMKGIVAVDGFFDAAATKSSLGDLGTLNLNDYYFSFGLGPRILIAQFPLRFLFTNSFRIQNGAFEWSNGEGPDWTFVLSFNIANL